MKSVNEPRLRFHIMQRVTRFPARRGKRTGQNVPKRNARHLQRSTLIFAGVTGGRKSFASSNGDLESPEKGLVACLRWFEAEEQK